MKKVILLVVLAAVLCGCGHNEPSSREIALGMIESFANETGIDKSALAAKAKKIGNGRWAVSLRVDRYGQQRILNATAVMDGNGEIHFYTD